MVDQIDKLHPGHEVLHESNHSMLIFKIKNAIPKLRTKMISLPEPERREEFKAKVAEYISAGTGPKIDILYDAIKKTCSDLRLVRTNKGFRKLKFYWSQEDWDE